MNGSIIVDVSDTPNLYINFMDRNGPKTLIGRRYREIHG
jgi:hypothetical protein